MNNINSHSFFLVDDLSKGFLRGSIFKNIFDPYKYVVTNITKMTDEEALMYKIQTYEFVKKELTIYLSNYPDDKDALESLNRINMERKKMIDEFERKYHSLSSGSFPTKGYFGKRVYK